MITAILLAAGKSVRMKGENKLIKKINGIPMLKHSVQNILDSNIDEIIIVVGFQSESVKKIIDKNKKIKFIFNKDFETGMASSIKIGLENLSTKTENFFISLADMPTVNMNIYNELIKFKDKKEIIVPIYKGQQGNPVLFSVLMKNKIKNIKGDIGAKKILEINKEKILNVEINDECIKKDFNTKENFNL